MNYQQLEKIANRYISSNSIEFPRNAFKMAQELNLRVKNSIECKKDFKENYPLYNCNAAYALVNGEYTIYHDEKYAYKNFSVAHEIAHHLLEHCSDAVKEHHDANLLAAILLLPLDGVINNKIKNAIQLSERYLIPYNVACEYWSEIKDIVCPKNIFKNKVTYLISGIVLIITIIIGFTYYNSRNNEEHTYPLEIAIPLPSPVSTQTTTIDNNDIVFVTKNAQKYHKKDCFTISNSKLIQIPIANAIDCGYEPCSICIN